ncbi:MULTISPECIES: STAS domain-containing protein [Oscillospiraceae]|uniref:STAS domain-containing protein n=1 Tax=Oscillospiraceae TaxID=216572 RepID=UPI000B3756ED|nr:MULTISPECIES: STAS domain-containing protein [Oscillospiraceae]MBM6723599.1 STAS domain-containing protein [Pseudoflavonifractor phocaeensis]MBM6886220.1 STAS domain-containing protein [Pseudoflavonifractor phocaeensis]OUO40335.1 sulfate transporter [Flavonifractor sp. An306]HJB99664.1 STAS domain-containing protein [Candidatus Flavonifractor merdavium]
MAMNCRAEHRTLYAAIDGEVDHHRARELLAELDRQLDLELPRSVTLDLGGVSFMDSSGIAILLRARQRVSALGGALRVVHVPEQAAKVLRAAGVDKLMDLE